MDADNEEADDEEIFPAFPPDLQHIPLNFDKMSIEKSLQKSEEFYELMNKRRTVRHFSNDPVPKEIIHNIIKAAGKLPHFEKQFYLWTI